MQLMTQVTASMQIGCDYPQQTKQQSQISSMDQCVCRRSASIDTSFCGRLYISEASIVPTGHFMCGTRQLNTEYSINIRTGIFLYSVGNVDKPGYENVS